MAKPPRTRPPITAAVKQAVLIEAGYKCANPICRNVLALELHHIEWVKDGGPSTVDNLLALCGHCHDLHTQGHIARQAIDAWKSLLTSLNNPSRTSVDLLLVLFQEEGRMANEPRSAKAPPPFRFTGDGLGALAPLITSGLVQISKRFLGGNSWGGSMPSYQVELTEKGRQIVRAWIDGDTFELKKALELRKS